MKNSKGQALIEFILVLPIFLFVIISIIDFGNIVLKKYSLENEIDTVSEMYKLGNTDNINSYLINKNIAINYNKQDKFMTIKLTKDIKITSPILLLIFGKNYEISTEKSIYINE